MQTDHTQQNWKLNYRIKHLQLWLYSRYMCATCPKLFFTSQNSLRNVTRERIAGQRLDKHLAIRARNSRTNCYISLLGNSQRANGLAR
jgi:hypothetical protein